MRQVAGRAEDDDHARLGHPLEAQALAQRVRLGRPARLARCCPARRAAGAAASGRSADAGARRVGFAGFVGAVTARAQS